MAAPTPLTTIFTPPSGCLSDMYSTSQDWGWIQLGRGRECIPSGPDPSFHSYFSPGLVCPDGWTIACQSEISGTGSDQVETRATCCPRANQLPVPDSLSFSCNTVSPVGYQSFFTNYGCTMNLSGADMSYILTILNAGTSTTTSLSLDGGVAGDYGFNAYSVQLAWKNSDMTAATLSSTSSEVATGTINGTALSTAIDSSATETTMSGLSKDAKIAIGVCVPVVVIALIIGLFFFMRSRKLKSQLKGTLHNTVPREGVGTPPEVLYEKYSNQRHELDAKKRAELDTGGHKHYELP